MKRDRVCKMREIISKIVEDPAHAPRVYHRVLLVFAACRLPRAMKERGSSVPIVTRPSAPATQTVKAGPFAERIWHDPSTRYEKHLTRRGAVRLEEDCLNIYLG